MTVAMLYPVVSIMADPVVVTPSDMVVSGERPNSGAGRSVALLNLSGSGADLVVGAPYDDENGDSSGKVLIYFGGTLDDSPDIEILGSKGDRLGWSLACAGDVNGDDYDDLIVGAPYSGADTGMACIFFGWEDIGSLPSLDTSDANVTLVGTFEGGQFGWSVSTAGDINSDACSDVIVGEPYNEEGRAYIFYGAPEETMDEDYDKLFEGATANDKFGWSVAGGDNLDGTNQDDVVVGAPGSGSDRGSVQVILNPAKSTPKIITISGESEDEEFGTSVAIVDFNHDLYGDVAVGAPLADDIGKVYLYHGSSMISKFDKVVDMEFCVGEVGDQFGLSISAGDPRTDTKGDLVVGAPFNDLAAIDAGRAYVFYGNATPDVDNEPDVITQGDESEAYFGWSVASGFESTADFNGDEAADFAVGAMSYGANGAAFLYLGVLVPGEKNPVVCGYVYDLLAETALEGARVTFQSQTEDEVELTDEDGWYEMILLPGVYYINASFDDYFSNTTIVTLVAGAEDHEEIFRLDRYPVIGGVVLNGVDSSPLQDALVKAFDDSDELLDDKTTSGTGSYEFVLEYEGSLTLLVTYQDYFDEEEEVLDVGRNYEDPVDDITLNRKPILLVTVTDSKLSPPDDAIEGAEVEVTIDSDVVTSGTTNASGVVRLVVDGYGDALVNVTKLGYFDQPQSVTLVNNSDEEPLTFSMERKPLISGKVRDYIFGTTIAGAEVALINSTTYGLVGTTETSSTGYYSFESIEKGTYNLRVTAVGYLRQYSPPVTVESNDETSINFNLERDGIPPDSLITSPLPPVDIDDWLLDPEFTISVDVTDPNGNELQDVTLYYRHGETGIYKEWETLDYEDPCEFVFNASNADGDGVYSFYTIARDWAGNVESAPLADDIWAPLDDDTWVVVASGKPVSHVEEIVPDMRDSDTFTVTVNGDEPNVASVELWYWYNDGPTPLVHPEVGDELPYSWEFVAPDDGVYGFYSILENALGLVEDAPEDPDTEVLVDTTRPSVTIVKPTDTYPFDDAEIDLEVDVSDYGAGLDEVGYRVDSEAPIIIDIDDGTQDYTLQETLTLSDGTHTISVWAVDVLEWESDEAQVTIEVDTTLPTVTIEYPKDGDAVSTADVNVTWTVSEEIKVTKVRLDSGSWEVVEDAYKEFPDLDDGQYTVYVNVTDFADYEAEAQSTFEVDTGLPTVQITSPDDDDFLATSTVLVTWDQEDAGSGLKSVTVQLDDEDPQAADTEPEENEMEFESLAEGVHTVTVNATDWAGNYETDEVTFEVDGTPPEIAIVSPEDGSCFATDTVDFEWSAYDYGTGVKSVEYRLDGSAWDQLEGETGTMPLPDLAEGTHTLVLRATDNALNNAVPLTVQFTVDTLDPDVTIDQPLEDEIVDTSDVDIIYTADGTGSDIAAIEVNVDGTGWEAAGASPITVESLTDDEHTVEIRVTDEAGNLASAIVNFTVDVDAPVVDITYPTDGLLLDEDSVTVTLTVSDMDATLEMKLDDGAWQPVTGTSHTLTDLSDGEHTVIVKATDDASNEGEDSVTFNVDTTPPTVSVTAPEEDAILGSSSVVVTWTAADAVTTERSVDGGAWLTVVGTSVTISSLVDGEHTISIRVADVAGHEATDSVTVLVDTTDPTVEITSPSEGATVGTEVTVEWTADDGSGSGIDTGEVSIDGGASWTAAIGSSHTFTGLTSGGHTVDVTVTDDAGNEGTDSVTFTVTADTTAPTVSITSPANDSSLPSSSVTVTWTASDGTGSGIDTIEVKLDAGTWTVVTGSTREFTALAEGTHMVSVRVTDNAGNAATATVTFMVDTVDPSLSITSPEAAWETEDKSVTVTWTCTDA
ncbi:MAG: Ig-like domain-containing protein, partial [Thermoplasmata archaeon]|nr:Ig-like domain-containing protein [Thermoplasmata archaeon]